MELRRMDRLNNNQQEFKKYRNVVNRETWKTKKKWISEQCKTVGSNIKNSSTKKVYNDIKNKGRN